MKLNAISQPDKVYIKCQVVLKASFNSVIYTWKDWVSCNVSTP